MEPELRWIGRPAAGDGADHSLVLRATGDGKRDSDLDPVAGGDGEGGGEDGDGEGEDGDGDGVDAATREEAGGSMVASMNARRALALALVNGLTFFRLGLAVTFPLITAGAHLPIVAIAAASDFTDGVIARRFDGSSWIGGLLDAVADKLFVFAVLYVVARDGGLVPWQIALLLSRDVAVALAAAYAVLKRRWDAFQHMPSRAWGKLTTAALFALFAILLAGPDGAGGSGWIRTERVAFGTAAACSILAAIDYTRAFLRARRDDLAGERSRPG